MKNNNNRRKLNHKQKPYNENKRFDHKQKPYNDNKRFDHKQKQYNENKRFDHKQKPYNDNKRFDHKQKPYNDNKRFEHNKKPYNENKRFEHNKKPYNENKRFEHNKKPYNDNKQKKFDQKLYGSHQPKRKQLINLLETFIKEENVLEKNQKPENKERGKKQLQGRALKRMELLKKKSQQLRQSRRSRWPRPPKLSKKEKKEKRIEKYIEKIKEKYIKKKSLSRYFTMIRRCAVKHSYLKKKKKKLKRFYRKNDLQFLKLNQKKFNFLKKKRKELLKLFSVKSYKIKKLLLNQYKRLVKVFLILIVLFSKKIKEFKIKNNLIFAIYKKLLWLKILCKFYFFFLKKDFCIYKNFLEKTILFYSSFLNKKMSLLGKYIYLNKFVITLLKPSKKLNSLKNKSDLEKKSQKKLKKNDTNTKKAINLRNNGLIIYQPDTKLEYSNIKFKKVGILYYRGKRRNLNLTFTNMRGKVLASFSAGNKKFRKSKRKVSEARYDATMKMAQRIKYHFYNKIVLVVKKWEPHYHFRKILKKKRIFVIRRFSEKRKPHNGCRKRKPKRK